MIPPRRAEHRRDPPGAAQQPALEDPDQVAGEGVGEGREAEGRLQEQVHAEAGGEPEDRAGLRTLAVRDGHRRDEAEVGDDARDPQVREDRGLHQDDRDQEQGRAGRRGSYRPGPRHLQHAHDRRARRRPRAAAPGSSARSRPATSSPTRRGRPGCSAGSGWLSAVNTSSPVFTLNAGLTKSSRSRLLPGATVRDARPAALLDRTATPESGSVRSSTVARLPRRLNDAAHETVAGDDRHAGRDARVGPLVERDRRLEVPRRAGDHLRGRRRRDPAPTAARRACAARGSRAAHRADWAASAPGVGQLAAQGAVLLLQVRRSA